MNPFQKAVALTVLIIFHVTLLTGMENPQEEDPKFRIIVHPTNPLNELSSRDLSNLFLKKHGRWEFGEMAVPVDLKASSELRSKFSQKILKRSTLALKNYWQQQIFSGKGVPPPELDSENEVVDFVKNNKGSLGYISLETEASGVKTLKIK